MAKRVEGRSDKLLQYAQEEFMEMGFQEASLRVIAARAETSTGSIYTRFGDKGGLFHALVDDVTEALIDWFRSVQRAFDDLPADQKQSRAIGYAADQWVQFLDFIYAHWETFRLLVRCADIDCYEKLLDSIVEIDVDYTYRFIESMRNGAIEDGRLSPMLLHMLSSAYYTGLFEVVRHEMSREEAAIYVRQVRRFFVQGWVDLLQMSPE